MDELMLSEGGLNIFKKMFLNENIPKNINFEKAIIK